MRTALVGRGADLGMLRAFCCGVDSPGRSLLLTGERGVGKTALLDAVADWASTEDFRVLRARAVRSELDHEFSTLNQLLLPLQDGLAGLQPADQQTLSQALGFVEGPSGDSATTADAAWALLGRAALDQRLLLVVDDLHWVDRSSAQVLALLRPRLDGSRTWFLGASRSQHVGFFDRAAVPGHPVRPLDPTAAAELIGRHLPELDPSERPGLLARSGGNPLALLELPGVGGSSPPDQLGGPVAKPPLSRRLQHVFAADILALPPPTRRLLLLLALAGTEDLGWCAGLADRPELQPAEQAGLVSVDRPARRLTFTHPLASYTVVALATSDECRTAHRELARRLADRPERRAQHLAEAANGPDETVAAELEAAAPALVRAGDAMAGVQVLRRSAALSENRANQARRLAQAAHLCATVVGDLVSADQLLQQARRSDPQVVGSLTYVVALAARALHGRGDADTAHHALVEALGHHLAHPDPDPDPGALVEAVQGLLDVCRWTHRPEHWRSLRAVLGELPSWAGLRDGGGEVVRLRLATLVDPPAPGGGEPARTDPAQLLVEGSPTALVRIAECTGRAGQSPYRKRLEAVVADGRGGGGTAVAIDAVGLLAQDAFTSGEWDRAGRLADEGLAWCHRRGDQLRGWTLTWVKALVAAGRGEVATVDRLTEPMLQWADRQGFARVRSQAHHARALAALGIGQFERAYAEAVAAVGVGSPSPQGPGTLEPTLCLVEAAAHTRRRAAAARQAELLRTPDDLTPPRTALLVAAATALAAPDSDRAQLFERAFAQADSTHCPFDLARVHLAYGQLLRRSRSTSMARAHLRTALDIFERLGARPWVERTRIELGATGETRQQTEPFSTLTPQERTVALLAASGHTNKQIAEKLMLTHRTVAAHLHQVFRKLKVDSRAALRDALDPRGREAGQTQPDSLVSS